MYCWLSAENTNGIFITEQNSEDYNLGKIVPWKSFVEDSVEGMDKELAVAWTEKLKGLIEQLEQI